MTDIFLLSVQIPFRQMYLIISCQVDVAIYAPLLSVIFKNLTIHLSNYLFF